MSRNPLNDLYRDASAPAGLRQRVEATLRARGLVSSSRASSWRPLRAAGLVTAALIAGFLAGRANLASPSGGPRYLLLLYEDSTYRDDRPTRAIVGEYARWADSLRRHGALELGEKLADARVVLRGETSTQMTRGPGGATGLFILRAGTLDEARAIAQTSPHLRYGGHVELRAIETGSDR